MELQRQYNEPLNDLEEEAKERAQHLLEKANEQRQEQEDEIKHLNEVHYTTYYTALHYTASLSQSKSHHEKESQITSSLIHNILL